MFIRGGDSAVSLREIADAITAGEQVVIARKLDHMAVICLEEELTRLTDMSISLNWNRGRYTIHGQPFEGVESNDEDDDFEGQWVSIPPQEVELAVAIA